jgi:hypothetical protein
MPLKAFVTGPRPGYPPHLQADLAAPVRPTWEAAVHHWLFEEHVARQGGTPPEAEKVIARGEGRLFFRAADGRLREATRSDVGQGGQTGSWRCDSERVDHE